MRVNILFGGEAGQGPNILTNILGMALVKQGYYVFYSRDYQSLIRGGHNFNVLTFSDTPVYSNDSEIDIIVALDDKTLEIHRKHLKNRNMIISGKHPNMYFAGRLFKVFCLDFSILEEELKELEKRFEENMEEAKKGYEEEKNNFCSLKFLKKNDNLFMNGSQGIAEGAVKSGLDVYYAYPMTPATSVLTELAGKQESENILVIELENEIAVANAGVGSAITGAKTMIGTSGGGFDLMTETLSLCGMAEVPLIFYLAQRPGPATGVATYTAQGDLNLARHGGHGEFTRIVVAPGDPNECQELTSQSFYFSQKYKIPCIIISDKHLGESFYTLDKKLAITPSKKSTQLIRYNSYEKDKEGSSTDVPEVVNKNIENRLRKADEIGKEVKLGYKIHGKKSSKNVILGWGSTKGAILDSIKDLDCSFLQILFIEPFPEIKKELEGKNLILIENNAAGQLGSLLAEKTGIFINGKNEILRYDGRPFLADELKKEIERRLRR